MKLSRCIAVLLFAASAINPVLLLNGCGRGRIVFADSPVACLPESAPGLLTQTWLIGNPPSSLTPGVYAVTLADGEALPAVVQLNAAGPEEQLILPIAAADLPLNGIAPATAATPAGLVQLGCPAMLPSILPAQTLRTPPQ